MKLLGMAGAHPQGAGSVVIPRMVSMCPVWVGGGLILGVFMTKSSKS